MEASSPHSPDLDAPLPPRRPSFTSNILGKTFASMAPEADDDAAGSFEGEVVRSRGYGLPVAVGAVLACAGLAVLLF